MDLHEKNLHLFIFHAFANEILFSFVVTVATTFHSVYHKATQDNETFTTIETRLTYARLTNLKPNSQHIIYVVAIGEKGESLPSETLVAFTDPALPAFVDVCVFACVFLPGSLF